MLVLAVDERVDAVDLLNLPGLEHAKVQGQDLLSPELRNATVSPRASAKEIAVGLEAVQSPEEAKLFNLGQLAGVEIRIEVEDEKIGGLPHQRASQGAIEARHAEEVLLCALLQNRVGCSGAQPNVSPQELSDGLGLKAAIGVGFLVQRGGPVDDVCVHQAVAERVEEHAAKHRPPVDQVLLVEDGRGEHERLQILQVPEMRENQASQLGRQRLERDCHSWCDGQVVISSELSDVAVVGCAQ